MLIHLIKFEKIRVKGNQEKIKKISLCLR